MGEGAFVIGLSQIFSFFSYFYCRVFKDIFPFLHPNQLIFRDDRDIYFVANACDHYVTLVMDSDVFILTVCIVYKAHSRICTHSSQSPRNRFVCQRDSNEDTSDN